MFTVYKPVVLRKLYVLLPFIITFLFLSLLFTANINNNNFIFNFLSILFYFILFKIWLLNISDHKEKFNGELLLHNPKTFLLFYSATFTGDLCFT